jgi:hypothetical protein
MTQAIHVHFDQRTRFAVHLKQGHTFVGSGPSPRLAQDALIESARFVLDDQAFDDLRFSLAITPEWPEATYKMFINTH